MTKGNGNKDPIEQVVEQLVALRAEMKEEFRELRTEVASVNVRLDKVNGRLDKVIENTGSHYRRLEERVAALEGKVH